MRRQPCTLVTIFSATLTLCATSAFALPTEKGRSADVYQNAARYFEAVPFTPEVQPLIALRVTPKLRPEGLVPEDTDTAAPVALADASVAPRLVDDYIAGFVPLGFSAGDENIDIAPTLPRSVTEAYPLAAQIAPVMADAAGKADEVPTTAQIEAPDAIIVAAEVAEIATEVSIDAVAQAPADDIAELAQDVETAFEVAVDAALLGAVAAKDASSLAASADATTPSSARDPEAGGDAEIAAETGPEAEAKKDDMDADALMAEMAEGNADLQIRDGGEDGPDTMMMSSDVLFSFGKAELAPDAIATLASIGETFAEAGVIEVLGHTDAIGSEANNLALGQQRAEAVRAWLLSNSNIPAERVIATGVGEGDPVAPNTTENGQDDPIGRAQNRRVEFAFR